MNDLFYDKLLNIQTIGDQKGINSSVHYHRYEPTPYEALNVLFHSCALKSSDHIVDFGCGKGRLLFYIHHIFQAHVVGIEMNHVFYDEAVANLSSYLRKNKTGFGQIHFHHCVAEKYEIQPLDNRFYFFNPFSIQILMKIINNILHSVEKYVRDVELILYYSSEDYIHYLENYTPFELKAEIIIPGLYEKNPNERFLIYVI